MLSTMNYTIFLIVYQNILVIVTWKLALNIETILNSMDESSNAIIIMNGKIFKEIKHIVATIHIYLLKYRSE